MKTITYVANLIDYKAHLDLVESWKLVLTKHDPVFLRLWLIGTDRGERQELESKVHTEDIPGITFWGYQADVGPFLKKSTIYVHPSKEEGCSNAILEAMAYCLPVVATSAGGNPELVKHGKTGLIVKVGDIDGLADSILALLRNRNMAKSMGLRGALRARSLFRQERMVKKYGDLYVRICGSTRQGTPK